MSDADRVTLAFTEEAVFGTTPVGTITAITISAAAADNSVNDSGNGFVAAGFVAGQYIDIAGFTGTAANNQKGRVLTVAAGKMTLETDTALVDDAAGESVTILSALNELRLVSESLGGENTSVESAEIRDDRQINDVIRTLTRAAGDLNYELSFSAYDHLIEAAFLSAGFSTEVEDISGDTTISAANGDNSFNDSANGFGNYVLNQWIKTAGFATAANNGFFKITSAAAGKLIVSGGTLTTEAAGPAITITQGAQVVNGVALRTFSMERQYTDLTNKFEIMKGMAVNQLSMSIQADQIITGAFAFIGKNAASAAASVITGGNKTAPTKAVMAAVDSITAILEGQAAFASTQFSLELVNNLRERLEIGTLGAASIGSGAVGVTGTLQAFFTSETIIDKFLNFTTSTLALVIEDVDGNGYIVDFPRVKYTQGQRVAGGQNTDVLADMTFSAFREPTEDVTIRFARFPA